MPFSREVKYQIAEAQNFYCAEEGCLKHIHSIHHCLHDTKPNRKRFPLFIDSPMNGKGLCFDAHSKCSHKFKITVKEAEIYEAYLEKLIKCGGKIEYPKTRITIKRLSGGLKNR